MPPHLQHGAKTDVFSGAVEDQHVPYINPSENGGKADVRWMVLRRGQGGAGVLLKAENGAVFQVGPNLVRKDRNALRAPSRARFLSLVY